MTIVAASQKPAQRQAEHCRSVAVVARQGMLLRLTTLLVRRAAEGLSLAAVAVSPRRGKGSLDVKCHSMPK